MGLLLANGSMSSNTSGEGDIRKRLLEQDKIECIVALPGQLFTNTQIPACIWFLTNNKKARTIGDGYYRDRTDEVLFIDARNLGYMKDRVLRDFKPEDIENITKTFLGWQMNYGTVQVSETVIAEVDPNPDYIYHNQAGYCYSATLDEIIKHDYVLTPGRYVGLAVEEEDSELFAEKMTRLTSQLKEQFEQSDKLEAEIKKSLSGLGYEL
jgi:type I restriction enzyme M protein